MRGEPNGGRSPIRFGTSGWRGVLGEDFTFERARAAVAGVAAWAAAERRGARVLVAHDRRFLAGRFADEAAALLAARGLPVRRARGAVATPVVAHALARGRAELGLVFTASHNPPEYEGLKVLGAGGASLPPEDTRRIEAHIAEALASPPRAEASRAVRSIELVGPYLRALERFVDARAFRGRRLQVHVDAMHGVGAGVLDEALRRLGARTEGLRLAADPTFGGIAPDPCAAHLAGLRRAVAGGKGLRLGLATDGDADRFAAVDADGALLSETESVALLVDHLARTGRARRGVAISIATGSLVERVAQAHGLAVTRHPIGFKHLAAAFAAGVADVAGEESGGFACARFSHDKDGMLAGCLLSEIVASTRAPLRERLRALERRFGASACSRIALPASDHARAALARLMAAPPERVGASRVRAAARDDGLHLAFDDGFLLLRASGTEPLLRIYAEARSAAGLARRLREGSALLGGPRASRRRPQADTPASRPRRRG